MSTSDQAAAESISATEIGLPAGARVPFRFVPGQRWSPLVISFPHVGLNWPHDLRPKPQVAFPANADYEVHRLYEGCDEFGAAALYAVYSRLVVDLNRAPDDVSRTLVPDHPAPRPRQWPGGPPAQSPPTKPSPGRGVIWDRAVGNVPVLSRPLRYAEFTDRIRRYHTPYHRALRVLLERRRARFGYAVLLDAHSMPGSVGVDLVLGTLDGRSCAPDLADLALSLLREASPEGPDLSVQRDVPYRGGELVRSFGRPEERLHALQLEVSRSRYMDERSHRVYAIPSARSGDSARRHHPPTPAAGPDALAELSRRVKSLVRTLARPGLLHASGDNVVCEPGQ